MRRRLLLERAAYRLLTCDEQVVDLAFEAGYGSHEAFTWAFAREYGTAPSRWRQHPHPHPDRGSERRALPPARQPAVADLPKGDPDGPHDADDRAPHLADLRDDLLERPG